MTTEAAKEIYQHAGMKLRLAREQAGLDIREIATRTKLTPKVVQQLEEGEGDIFKTPLFVRGQLRSYARALGVDIVPDIQQLVSLDNPAPVLEVRETVAPASRALASAGQYSLYFLVTAVIGVSVISSLNLFRGDRDPVRPLDGPAATAEAEQVANELAPTVPVDEPMVASNASATATTPGATAATAGALGSAPAPVTGGVEGLSGFSTSVGTTVADPNAARQPMAASMAGALGNGVAFKFNQDSWVKFIAPDGSVIEQGLMPAGTVKQFAVGQLGKARIGAAEQVQMTVNGQPADITGFTKGSVANFTIGNDGQPASAAAR